MPLEAYKSYAAAQPSPDQHYAWSSTVSSILYTDKNCSSIVVPDVLKGIYRVFEFKDQASKQSFCIFSEISKGNDEEKYHNYEKGWGLLVVPSTRAAVSCFVHLSAPFPQAGINTVSQATAAFTGIGAKSLFIPGRNRNAYNKRSKCTVNPAYNKTSSVHDNIRNWQNRNGGCLPASCAHIQFMGKGASYDSDEQERRRARVPVTSHADSIDSIRIATDSTSSMHRLMRTPLSCLVLACTRVYNLSPNYSHFSRLLRNAESSTNQILTISNSSGWYGKNPNYSGRRIRDNLRKKCPDWKLSLPSDSSCNLIGSNNIVGRLLNGVDVSKVCTEPASPDKKKGEFAQLESSPNMRGKDRHEIWVEVLKQSCPAVNAAGMDIDDTDVWSE
ncbi:hypothetical protein AMATHDRAFT_87139 [Amanita thiersii Skay4041]|uniref:Uncharacterized protein n=1 Tax=Amanita thiersii Skay4041 TaxID=703135 RepID=A0A2A9NL09_9AGAR|nr:hypothetical protein AMATHDRAFT_87139 [Amanita thiersii Skay4041]